MKAPAQASMASALAKRRVLSLVSNPKPSSCCLLQKYLSEELGPEAVALMRTIKRAVDPHGIMNPGKVIDFDDGHSGGKHCNCGKNGGAGCKLCKQVDEDDDDDCIDAALCELIKERTMAEAAETTKAIARPVLPEA